jgi:hypothetical protein
MCKALLSEASFVAASRGHPPHPRVYECAVCDMHFEHYQCRLNQFERLPEFRALLEVANRGRLLPPPLPSAQDEARTETDYDTSDSDDFDTEWEDSDAESCITILPPNFPS